MPSIPKDEPRWRVTSSNEGFAYMFDNFYPVVVGNIHDGQGGQESE